MITFPNAKINLGLNITGKRPDGYHNLETVFYPVPLEDAMEVHVLHRLDEAKCVLHLSGSAIAGNPEENLVVKAYELFRKEFNLPPVEAFLYKHIPSGAGLGGGSSDAACMLKLLNERFQLRLTEEQLEAYATTLGADCPFFIRNEPTFASGIGNIFSPLYLSLKGYQLLIIKPEVFVSTREAFSLIKPHAPQRSLQEVIRCPLTEWKEWLINDFEESVFPQYPVIGQIKEELYKQGAIYAAMSGSGSSLFGLFSAGAELPDIRMEKTFQYKSVLE